VLLTRSATPSQFFWLRAVLRPAVLLPRRVFDGDALPECPSLLRILAASSLEGTKVGTLAMRLAMLFVHGGSGLGRGVVGEQRVQPY
jgi:hypothetical protein